MHEQTAVGVADYQIDCTMQQVLPAHLGSRRPTDHSIPIVDDVDELTVGDVDGLRNRPVVAGNPWTRA
jgi:hypothetical protein